MIFQVFSVRDRATACFLSPMFLHSHGHALRMFGDEVNRADKDNMIFMHPEDFDLYHLGEFDSSDGTFKLNGGPQQVGIGKDLAIKKQ